MAYINGNKALSVVQTKYLTPSGTKRITRNGVYNVSGNDKAIVAVMPSGTVTRIDDDGIAYEVDIPTGALHHMLVNKLGGMSYKFNQLAKELNATNWTTDDGNTTYSDGVATFTATSQWGRIEQELPLIAGHKVLFMFDIKGTTSGARIVSDLDIYPNSSTVQTIFDITTTTNFVTHSMITTINQDTYYYGIIDARSSGLDAIQIKNVLVIDLTDIYGAGNEPTTIEEFKATYNKDYYDYTLPTLHHSPVTMVDSNIELLPIPNEVQALDGYGMGINSTLYNYIDFETKKFKKNVGIVDLGSLEWTRVYNSNGDIYYFVGGYITNNGNNPQFICSKYARYTSSINYMPDKVAMIYNDVYAEGNIFIRDDSYTDSATFKTAMSGVYLVYELDTPVETDISAYIDNNLIEIDEAENVEFKNQYSQAVPYSISYQVEEE